MLKNRVAALASRLGRGMPRDIDDEARRVIEQVRPFTMTSPERLFGLIQAVRYVVRFDIPGAIVECGVWRGGSMMAAALTLQSCGAADRELLLYDTFEGMSEPTAHDTERSSGRTAAGQLARHGKTSTVWAVAGLAEVQANLASTGYPEELVTYVTGKVEDTLPGTLPGQVAVLRLDTDWYESTRHELEHLPGLVSPGGVLVIDDYGHWEGARKAVDEWLAAQSRPVLLQRLDYTGRIAVLP